MDQRSIFKPRESGSLEPSSTKNTSEIVELTKNSKYCVSKLPASPSVLHEPLDILNGYTDNISNYALVVSDKTINVWSYKSTDATPLSIQFPVANVTPLAILTRPTITEDPGLVIMDASIGSIKFYESVQHAPALGLINNKSLNAQIPLNDGEFVILAENVEPAGIAIATSHGRCFLLSLRDFANKPNLQIIEIPLKKSRGLLGFLKTSSMDDVEIVSIKTKKLVDGQALMIQDSKGNFNYITLQHGPSGVYLDKTKSYHHSILPILNRDFEALSGNNIDAEILDLWPIQSHNEVYIALTSLNDDQYVLVTMKIDETGALLYGSHKLQIKDNWKPSSQNRPKLFLPLPGNTAFIIIDSLIILTDIDFSYIESQNTVQYYTPRWEDTIKLKSSIEIIGYGFENQTINTNPSIILITTTFGILRVERFPTDKDSNRNGYIETDSVQKIVKSHIEQAIFFSNNSAIDFDLNEQYQEEDITAAVLQVSDEIMSSTSPYLPALPSESPSSNTHKSQKLNHLPSIFPTVGEYLNLKIGYFETMILFVKRNFGLFLVPEVLKRLEKVKVALNLWNQLKNNSELSAEFQNISKKSMDEFFCKDVKDINEVLTLFVEHLVYLDTPFSTLIQLLVATLYEGVYLTEEKYMEDGIPPTKLWVFDTDLIVKFEEIYRKAFGPKPSELESIETKSKVIQLCEVLYYLVNNAIQFMQSSGNNLQLKEYIKWYNTSKKEWIRILLSRGIDQEALKISEHYSDFSSLVEVLEARRLKTDSVNDVEVMYNKYFDKFGYEFASKLYDNYIENDHIQRMLLKSNEYNEYAVRYFKEFPEKTSNFSWIRDFLDGNFNAGSEALIRSTADEENINNLELKASLAKLGSIAASSNSTNAKDKMDEDDKETVTELNQRLIHIRIQKEVYQELTKDGNILNGEFISRNYINENVNIKSLTDANIVSICDKLSKNVQLESVELINLLTLIKPNTLNQKGFTHAFRIASILTNESEFIKQTRIIWLRLLGLTDDWNSLTQNIEPDIAINKSRIENSTLYKTFQCLGSQKDDITSQLDYVLSNVNSIEDFTNAKEKVATYIDQNDLKRWIQSIRSAITLKNSN